MGDNKIRPLGTTHIVTTHIANETGEKIHPM